MEASLSSIIGKQTEHDSQADLLPRSDPELQEADFHPLTPASPSPLPETSNSKPKKVRGIVLGSTADFRRREANRSAAERSRSRQHEKVVALEMAAQALSEENLRLKEELGRYGDEGMTIEGIVEDSNATTDALANHPIQNDSSIEGDAQQESDAQDSHSRTILAALMSGAGVDDFNGVDVNVDGDEASWMQGVDIQGVETLFKEAESSGRLREFAAVAAGNGAGSDQALDTVAPDQDEAVPVLQLQTRQSRPSSTFTSAAAAAATASAVAVAINAEMEKHLRDDMASTKSAIAKIEREMTRLRGEATAAEPDEDAETASSLPLGILSTDAAVLQAKADEMQTEISRLQEELPVRREVVLRMRDAKVDEESKLASVVSELQTLGMGGAEEEREKIGAVLRAIGGYVGSMLGGLHTDVSCFLPPGIRLIFPDSGGAAHREPLFIACDRSSPPRPPAKGARDGKVFAQHDVRIPVACRVG